MLNFGQLNGQIGRRCLPVHFSRYRLEREADCLEFQSALVSLLEQVPLRCDVETLVGSYWVYFYEGCIGCIGVLKDWLMRAVSAALDEGQEQLTLDCLQDHILPTDILRQMALDASEGEQKLEHTESNREHLWRILQGGELIVPIPPLPPRGVPSPPLPTDGSSGLHHKDEIAPPPSPASEDALPTASPVKKTRSRKKVEVPAPGQEQGSIIQAEPGAGPASAPPKRRRKKAEAPVTEDNLRCDKAPSVGSGEAPGLIDVEGVVSPAKPKRTRRVGEPKPKRYAVGEPETGHNT